MIPFSPPRIDNKIIEEITDTLKSGWITTGPKTKRFEQEISKYSGVKKTLCVNSATAGLELMLRWFGVEKGDEVILPAYTYSATANVIVHCGAIPVFVDIKEDFNISVSNIEKAITKKTKTIMPVDFGGLPCDHDEIKKLVNQNEIKSRFVPNNSIQKSLGRILILVDAAHSFGAKYKEKRSGCLSDVSVTSFHAVKNLTTAEGGAICLNLPEPFDNEQIYKDLCIKSLHGQTKDALAKTKPGAWKYDIVDAGYKYNMTDILASIGLVELSRYESDTLLKRKYICDKYSEKLRKYNWAQIPIFIDKQKTSSYHLYPLRIKNIDEIKRDHIISKISEKDVAVNVHFIPLPMMSFYKELGYDIKDYPTAYDNYSREISLPVYYDLNDEQINHVIEAVVESVDQVINSW